MKDPICVWSSFNEITYHHNYDEMAKTVSIDNIKYKLKVPQSDIDEMSS